MNVQETKLRNLTDDAEQLLLDRGSLFMQRTAAVAALAAAEAEAVDREGRFPQAAIDAAREQKLLGMQIPVEFGGFGATIHDIADVCYTLGRGCASTAMIFAMHQTKVACLVRHGRGNPYMEALMRRIAREQLLLASSTTEGQNGGNLRASAAAIGRNDDEITLLRDATVISYGAEADGLVTVARRAGDAAASDQVLLALVKDDYSLKRTLGWETLGMRGTCSTGFELKVSCPSDRVFAEPYDRIHAQTMAPFAHLTWSSAWAGVAAAAVQRAQRFIRKAARSAGGQTPPAAAHFTAARMSLAKLRAVISANMNAFITHEYDERALSSLDFQSSITLLKVEASELAVEFSISRHLRDVLSAPIMINNDRILANVATASLMSAVPTSLHD
jgi:acyl-CoA dehydrogenase